MRLVRILMAIVLGGVVACGGSSEPGGGTADASGPDASPGACPSRGSGRHRLFMQGHEAASMPDGAYPMLHDEQLCDDEVFTLACETPPAQPPCECSDGDGVWELDECPAPLGPVGLVHGEHFLVGAGAFAEFRTTLCDDITGEVALYIPNFDQEGSRALHQVFVVHDGVETLVGEAIDDEPGVSGYNPFVRMLDGDDPVVVVGDELLLRTTNLSGHQYSVMVWRPPSDYESWLLVTVP